MLKCIRRTFFVFYTVVFRLPIWAIIWLVGRTGVIKTVFVIYPHDEKEYEDLCPNFKWFVSFLSGRPVPGGIIFDGIKPMGIYFYISNTPQELVKKKNRHIAKAIVSRMQWIQKISGAKTCGFAGQLGLILERRHGIAMKPPFFASTMGNIFSIDEAIFYLTASRKLKKPWQLSVAVLGGGELGERLVDHLSGQGYVVKNVDVKFKRRGGVELKDVEAAYGQLNRIDFVVNLLHTGEDFIRCNMDKILQETTAVIDFSRPPIPQEKLRSKVYMGNRVQHPGMRFVFALPGWGQRELPACSIPSIMAAKFDIIEQDLAKFCGAARKVSFTSAIAAESTVLGRGNNKALLSKLGVLENGAPVNLHRV